MSTAQEICEGVLRSLLDSLSVISTCLILPRTYLNGVC